MAPCKKLPLLKILNRSCYRVIVAIFAYQTKFEDCIIDDIKYSSVITIWLITLPNHQKWCTIKALM
jgi:hypothetical protein